LATPRSPHSGSGLIRTMKVAGLLTALGFWFFGYGQAVNRVSDATAGLQTTGGHSNRARISADGRFIAFDSYATNFVPGDTRPIIRVFVHNRSTGTTKFVSGAMGGSHPDDNNSVTAALSADGRYIVFASGVTNLVPGDTNQQTDIFVYDRLTEETKRVNVASDGAQAFGGPSASPSISADGRFVAFASSAVNLVPGDTNGLKDIFVHDRQTGATTRVSVATGGGQPAGGGSDHSAISADGRFIAFDSDATDLVPDDTNGFADIFVHDRVTGTTQRVSVDTGGAQAVGGDSRHPAISADGRFVAFHSEATNLGPGDTNEFADIFVHDRVAGTTQRVSVDTGGGQAIGGHSFFPSISADGRYVAFQSDATNLVPNDTNGKRDIFVHDRQTGATTRVSVATGGGQALGGGAARPSISADGRYVAFESGATNLVPDDTNDLTDIFVHDRETNRTTRVSMVTDDTASKAP